MSSQVQQRLRGRCSPVTRIPRVGTIRTFEEKPPPLKVPGCNCERPYGIVFCKVCGWVYQSGRVRTPCPVHSRTMYLLDIQQCPKCKAYPPLLMEMH